MGSLEARRVAEGDRTSFWQAVIVDLFFGGSAWWDSSCPAASLQAGIDARGTRGDFQRHYGRSIGTIDRQVAWPLTLDGEPGAAMAAVIATERRLRMRMPGRDLVTTRDDWLA